MRAPPAIAPTHINMRTGCHWLWQEPVLLEHSQMDKNFGMLHIVMEDDILESETIVWTHALHRRKPRSHLSAKLLVCFCSNFAQRWHLALSFILYYIKVRYLLIQSEAHIFCTSFCRDGAGSNTSIPWDGTISMKKMLIFWAKNHCKQALPINFDSMSQVPRQDVVP